MTNWNFDLSEAPRGHIETRTRLVKDEPKPFDFFVEEHIWAATKCGKVIVTHWMPKAGRWNWLATGEEPVAWMLYLTPEYPLAVATGNILMTGCYFDNNSGQISALLPIIEDAGGGV